MLTFGGAVILKYAYSPAFLRVFLKYFVYSYLDWFQVIHLVSTKHSGDVSFLMIWGSRHCFLLLGYTPYLFHGSMLWVLV